MSTTTTARHFIFGYGSLMCRHSRAKTVSANTIDAAAGALPVVVHGVERLWSKHIRGMTAMGVVLRRSSKCVGVLVPLENDKQVYQFDERELGYHRVALELDQVHAVPYLNKDQHYKNNPDNNSEHCTSSISSNSSQDVFWQAKQGQIDSDLVKLWLYVPHEHRLPCHQHPIAQSYVDVCLRSCLEYSEAFATDFLKNTKGWKPHLEQHVLMNLDNNQKEGGCRENNAETSTKIRLRQEGVWVNDRHDPIYRRSDVAWSRKNARRVDRLLQKNLPECFPHGQQSVESRLNNTSRLAMVPMVIVVSIGFGSVWCRAGEESSSARVVVYL